MPQVVYTVSTPTVEVNDVIVPIVQGSLSYTEGLGEQNIKVMSAGGNTTQLVYSENVETRYSDVKFKVVSYPAAIAAARAWKTNGLANTVKFTDNNGFTRKATQAAIMNNYEVTLGADGEIAIEWKTNPVV